MPVDLGTLGLAVVLLAVMLLGLFSLAIPGMPGLTIIWLAVLVYALIHGLTWATGILFAIDTLLMIVGSFVDNVFMSAGAKKGGASWLAVGVAIVGGLAGSLLWPPLGGILLALVGIFVVEIIRVRDLRKAWESTRGLAMGCGASVLIRFGMGVIMILFWGLWFYLVNR